MDDAPRLHLLRPHQRARLAAIEASGLTYPGMRLFMETLEAPKSCRSRACRRAKACIGDKLQCVRDNRELLVNEVLPAVTGERPR
ncbi:MAG: hypothetical protein QOH65_1734 [Methylobacteriaceae bacterium]|jgi:hypothetical protein|nr:hypothetical protein [Methylobacteriaceae bacterium]